MSAADLTLRPIAILSLDDGGVRGLVALLILREFIRRLEYRWKAKGLWGEHQGPLRPCNCFKLIMGSGTGGISALFLGRLRMTIDEAINEYIQMAETVFKPAITKSSQQFHDSQPLFDGDALESHLAGIVERHLKNGEALMAADNPNNFLQCHTAVLATTAANVGAPPLVFRSYALGEEPSRFTIVQVARATFASAGVFPPVSLGYPPVSFIDAGSAGYNNPTEMAIDEAVSIWSNRESYFVLSIGTGIQQIISAEGGHEWDTVKEISQRMVRDCEMVHDRLSARHLRGRISYNRLNVEQGLQSLGLKEWEEVGPNGGLAGITSAFMRKGDALQKLERCLEAIDKVVDKPVETTLGRKRKRENSRGELDSSASVGSEASSSLPARNLKPTFRDGGQEFMDPGFIVNVSETQSGAASDIPAVQSKDDAIAATLASSSLPTRNPKPVIFHGREDYLNQAINVMLSGTGAHLAILGPGGIGKTTIARAILHDKQIIQAFSKNRYFISCETFTSPALLIDTISLTLGVPSTSSDRLNTLLEFIEDSFADRRLLVILDNFETLWDERDRYADLESSLEALGSQASLSLIVTMRGSMRPPGVNWTHPLLPPVETLKIDAAQLTYRQICPTNDESLDLLLAALDCVPLAVTLMEYIPGHWVSRWPPEAVDDSR